ncbi:aminodeoxychorismate/anthranilate synthase component II [Reichenbachiella agarivorans]|uniref:Aminodeoxychorismate/anthranilate synthase component II n=1 Tax=Reichenbachiella agarivorans TaxID=2979464 RepID=A0ABY6CMW0_9BACT|nr:aminodeoxychorismate/anthranilate synthase component II [Reichenbachiella agarivorans]UXP31854.1 aminodeoxychorismate/anthranilate synthase component II [Reichenbachiella agarivorans]
MKTLVLDNYDSFTYNLVHIIRELEGDENLDVYRNDQISLAEVAKYDRILLSPGPGLPKDSGILMDTIRTYAPDKNILGVCLGHQAIAECFGGVLYNLPNVLHGIATNVNVQSDDVLFKDIPKQFKICRYHSWAVDPKQQGDIVVTAVDDDQEIMALVHKDYQVRGVQFHPESILTEHGIKMMDNWMKL